MKTYVSQGRDVTEQLEHLLRRAQLKPYELATRASMDRTLMDRWQRGQQSLGLEGYRRVAKALGVGIEQIPPLSNEMIVETHGVWYRLEAFRSSNAMIARAVEVEVGSLPDQTVNGRVGVSLPFQMDPDAAESANVLAPLTLRWEGHGPDALSALTELATRIDVAIEYAIRKAYFAKTGVSSKP